MDLIYLTLTNQITDLIHLTWIKQICVSFISMFLNTEIVCIDMKNKHSAELHRNDPDKKDMGKFNTRRRFYPYNAQNDFYDSNSVILGKKYNKQT